MALYFHKTIYIFYNIYYFYIMYIVTIKPPMGKKALCGYPSLHKLQRLTRSGKPPCILYVKLDACLIP